MPWAHEAVGSNPATPSIPQNFRADSPRIFTRREHGSPAMDKTGSFESAAALIKLGSSPGGRESGREFAGTGSQEGNRIPGGIALNRLLQK